MKLHFKLLLGAALTGLVGFTACGDTVPCGDSLAGGGFVGSGDCVGTADVSVDVQIDSRTDGAADTRTDGTTLEDGSTDGTTGDGSVATFSLGGSVTNLLGTGLVLRNGTDSLTVAKSATTYTLAGRVATGTAYAITANTQPTNPSQTCTVSNGAGTMGAANVTNANVTCTTDTFPVTVTVNGLKGTGLVLQNNGADDLSIGLPDAGNSTTGTFATKIASGADYAVTIKTQPADQSCTIAGATGTVVAGPITSVTVTCTNKTYMIGGAVSGLAGSGLVLQNNLGDDATINANGSFAFPTARESGTGYAVTVKTQPSNRTQVCTVTNGTGSVNAADVTNIGVTCVTTSFSVSATVSGLSGSGLVLQNNGGSNLAVGGNGVVTFSSSVLSGDAYAVTVLNNPSGPTQTCTVGNAAGTIGAANVTNVTVSCTTNKFAVGGNVSGLAGTGLVLQNNGGDSLPVSASGAVTFPTTLDSGSTYNVTVLTQPTNLSQTCTVTNGSGTVGSANVTNVAVSCVTNSFVVSAEVSGLAGSGLVLQNNGGNNRSVTSNGANAFSTSIVSGGTYSVSVLTQPTSPSQTCTVTSGSGTVTNGNVSATVTCVTNSFTIGGTLSGLTSGTLVLQNNGTNDLSLTANGNFTFSSPIASGAAYAVTRLSAPGSLACNVTSGSGTVGNGNVTNVVVTCVPAVTVFGFTGAQQTYTVPSGVTQIQVEALGAQGGVGTGPTGGAAGLGGRGLSILSVTPGEVIVVNVGGEGGASGVGAGGTGGFNGGGAGGQAGGFNGSAPTGNPIAGGGGGASDVRQGGSGDGNRVVVGGGGGGGGTTGCLDSSSNPGGVGGAGGAGGSGAGTKGGDSPTSGGNAGGGFGGTVGVGGLGGIGCSGFLGRPGKANGQGGEVPTCCCNLNPAGGGGGGGLVVGGGGGAGSAGTTGCSGNSKGAGGGGAGGSNLGTTTAAGVRAGNGEVIITAL